MSHLPVIVNMTASNCHVFINGPTYRHRNDTEANAIDFSSFRKLQMRFSSRGFSIRYVLSGTENYLVNGHSYAVTGDTYLLTNAYTTSDVLIDSASDVKGACVELSPALLAEVCSISFDPAKPYPERDLYGFLTGAGFFEHQYSAGKTEVGKYLQTATPKIAGRGFTDQISMEQFFYSLTEKILVDHEPIHKYVSSLSSVKASTRKDLLRRLLKGKELMDDSFTSKLTIGEIAGIATMSEYYFFRLFRSTFGCSPHQYLMGKRMAYAQTLLSNQTTSIKIVAWQCGFSDAYSFSKAFRNWYGINPSAFYNTF